MLVWYYVSPRRNKHLYCNSSLSCVVCLWLTDGRVVENKIMLFNSLSYLSLWTQNSLLSRSAMVHPKNLGDIGSGLAKDRQVRVGRMPRPDTALNHKHHTK